MGTQELAPQHNPLEYSSTIRFSGIKKMVEEVLFSSHAQELRQLNEIQQLTIARQGVEFNLRKVLSGIYRFSAIDLEAGREDQVTVTQNFVEVQTVNLKSDKKIMHLWNCPEAIDMVKGLLEKYSPSSTNHHQQVLFEP